MSLHKALEQGLDCGMIVIIPIVEDETELDFLPSSPVEVCAYGHQLWEGRLASIWGRRDEVAG